jgi:hypothetical protein
VWKSQVTKSGTTNIKRIDRALEDLRERDTSVGANSLASLKTALME